MYISQWCRKVKKIGGGPVVIGGDNLPSPVELGLTELPNIGSGTTVSMSERNYKLTKNNVNIR